MNLTPRFGTLLVLGQLLTVVLSLRIKLRVDELLILVILEFLEASTTLIFTPKLGLQANAIISLLTQGE